MIYWEKIENFFVKNYYINKTYIFKIFQVIYRGQSHPVENLNLAEIMPDTEHYMTYEGSTTYPGCWETVTWIVMNKPIYITRQEMYALKQLMQGDRINPKSPLGAHT